MKVSSNVFHGALVALSCLALAGCPSGPKPGAATPEEAFAQAKTSVTAGDYKGFYNLIAPAARDKTLGGIVFGAAMIAGFSGDEKAKADVEALSKKYAITEPPKDTKPDDLEAAMAKVVANVADKPACFHDHMAWMQTQGKKEKLEMGTLERVSITGDTAQGFEVTTKDGTKNEKPLHFVKVDGRWYMDITKK